MPEDLADAPKAVCREARSRFEEIALVLEEIPLESPFWTSVLASQLNLVVRGWRFSYEVEPETLRVTEVRPKQ
jgi:hypothetical protein